MCLEQWDKSSKVTFDKRMLAELVSLRFLEAHRHVVVLGPVGVGKTFVSQAPASLSLCGSIRETCSSSRS
jgi:DNA replication protein DnaC